MKRGAGVRVLREGEEGVSNVLGAVLLFGLLILTLVTIQVRFVPRWDEAREARLSDDVLDQVALLRADADRMARNATTTPLTQPLTLARPGGFTFFRSEPGPASAAFTPAAPPTGLQVSAPLLRLLERDGQSLHAVGEQWLALPASGSLASLTDIAHLRARIVDPNQENAGDSATLTLRDASGAYAGKVVLTFLRDASERSVQVEVFSASSATTPITVQRESYFHQVNPQYVYVNLLDDELLFGQVVAAATTPATLQFANSGLNADYSAAYTTAGGGLGGAAGGISLPNFATTILSGSLSLELSHQRLPPQTYIVEHGAILLAQPDGSTMVLAPSLGAAVGSQQLVVQWTLPALTGPQGTLSGEDRVQVALEPTGTRSQLVGVAARMALTIPTQFPGAWAEHWTDILRGAGLDPSGPSPQFTVTQDASAVHVNLFGPTSAPADTTVDILLRLEHAALDLTLLPA